MFFSLLRTALLKFFYFLGHPVYLFIFRLIKSSSLEKRNTAIKILTKKVRHDILKISYESHSGHIGSALSIADILTVLYFRVLKINPKNPRNRKRDKFILSKGHACTALYSVLYRKGFFLKKTLLTYHQNGSLLSGHSDNLEIPGIEAVAGSLGHGLSIGLGMALAGKHDKLNQKIYVLISDGECNEGEIWQVAMAANQFRLDNLVVIIDYNKSQALGSTKKIMNLEPFKGKWEMFGWSTREIDGHNLEQLEKPLKKTPFEKGKPSVIIAHTIIGKGVLFMEGNYKWHYFNLDKKMYQKALREVKK